MRQINACSFGEKMPELDKRLIIIPSHLEGSDDFYKGMVEDCIKVLNDLINDTDDKAEKECYQKEIETRMAENELYDVHWDDDEYSNTPVNDILDWEWLYLEELQGGKQ